MRTAVHCLLVICTTGLFAACSRSLQITQYPSEQTPAVKTQLFDNLAEAQEAAAFPFREPALVPDNLPLAQIKISEQTNGHQAVQLHYALPNENSHLNSHAVNIVYSDAETSETPESIRHPSGKTIQNQEETQIGGQTFKLYSTGSVAETRKSHIAWQQAGLNVKTTFVGNWFPLNEGGPGYADLPLLTARMIITSLQDWTTHTSSTWQVNFSIPTGWQQTGRDSFQSSQDYARLEVYQGPGSWTGQACEWEANAHPQIYGEQPALITLLQEPDPLGQYHDPCLILSPNDGPAAVLLMNPTSANPPFLILRMQGVFAPGVARSLNYNRGLTPSQSSPNSAALATPDPSTIPEDILPRITYWDSMIIEEYPIVDSSIESPGRLEFLQRIPETVLEKRRSLREQRGMFELSPVIVNGVKVTVDEATVQHPFSTTRKARVNVNGMNTFSYSMLPYAGNSHLYRLGSYADNWLLEVNGMLVEDGEIINQDIGCEEIHDLNFLNDKPLYFCVQDEQTILFHAGKKMPVAYDRVFHKACCESSVFNENSNDFMVWYYAERDGAWYYVEITVDEPIY